MTKQEQFKPRVPSIMELRKWSNQFGRMLKTNDKGTKLFGVDGKKVEFIERSKPDHFYISYKMKEYDNLHTGYSQLTRTNGSISKFRLDCPDGGMGFLTYAECDLVLGSNYDVIDEGYSSPGPEIRKIVFKADQHMAIPYYNAFELGASVHGDEIITDVIYYKIPQQRFRELRDWDFNLESAINSVKEERLKFKNGN